MITVKCDRCAGDIDPNGMIGYISWCFKQGVDGDLEMNELEGKHFCERCMDEIMVMIQRHVNWGTQQARSLVPKKPYEKQEIIEETPRTAEKSRSSAEKGKKTGRKSRISKEKGEAILELKARGFKIKEIAEELEMDPVQVKNWLYYHKEKE